ncbi:MAG TPA: hypothetical protein ACFYEE_05305, partial [Candidatus Wujingus californicus]|uniref:hypothetical protein n=1 Tax=Candidatus Wujingus californicus TaxID=3367618 RepID=UPI002712D3F4|nr:hypothetical protein [Candidatus Brocadiales bacterium]
YFIIDLPCNIYFSRYILVIELQVAFSLMYTLINNANIIEMSVMLLIKGNLIYTKFNSNYKDMEG